MTKMAKVTDKRSLQRSKDLTMLNLQLFEEMKNSVDEEVDCDECKITEEAKETQDPLKNETRKATSYFQRKG